MEQTNTNQSSKPAEVMKAKGDKVVDIPVAGDLEKTLIDLNDGLPQLPLNIKELLVKIAPWLTLLGAIFGVIALIGAIIATPLIMGGTAMAGMMGDYRAPELGVMFIISMVFAAATVALNFMAFPHLRVNNKRGWDLLYYGSLLSILQYAVMLNILGILIGGAISFYILFQIRPFYKY